MKRETPTAPPEHLANTEAELALLGTLMLHPRYLPDVLDQIPEGQDRIGVPLFSDPLNERLWQAILSARDQGQPPNEIFVLEHIQRAENPWLPYAERIEKALYNVSYHGWITDFARLVVELWTVRAASLKLKGFSLESDPTKAPSTALVARIQDAMAILDSTRKGGAQRVTQGLVEAMSSIHRTRAGDEPLRALVPFGMPGPDEGIGGMEAGQFVIVAGATGTGKSAFLTNVAANTMRHGGTVLAFPFEMSNRENTARMMCAISGVKLGRVLHPAHLTERDLDDLDAANNMLSSRGGEIISDDSCPTIRQLCATATQAKLRRPSISLIVVDYVQLVKTGSPKIDGGGNDNARVSTVSRELKQLAMRLGVVVLTASQFSRPNKAAKPRRPSLSDLRDSGALENDANGVILLHRPNLASPELEWQRAKWRSGQPTDWKRGTFNGSLMRFDLPV